MAEETVTLVYDGPAVHDGRMPVRELAPALLALGDLLAEANLVTHPEMAPLSLDIQAFDRASFDVHLAVHHTDMVAALFTAADSESLRQVIGWVTSLIELLKSMRGRRPENQERDGGRTRLTMPDGTVLETDTSVVYLLERRTIIESARQVVAPLRREGVELLSIEAPNLPAVRVEKSDLDSFRDPASPPDADIGASRAELLLTIVQPSFSEDYLWRVDDGGGVFTVTMEDKDFLGAIHHQEVAFADGDQIKAVVETRQAKVAGRLTARRSVIQVLEYFPVGRIVDLPIPEGDGQQ